MLQLACRWFVSLDVCLVLLCWSYRVGLYAHCTDEDPPGWYITTALTQWDFIDDNMYTLLAPTRSRSEDIKNSVMHASLTFLSGGFVSPLFAVVPPLLARPAGEGLEFFDSWSNGFRHRPLLVLIQLSFCVHGPVFYCVHTVFALLRYGILDLLIQPHPLAVRHYSQVPYKHKVHWFMQFACFEFVWLDL